MRQSRNGTGRFDSRTCPEGQRNEFGEYRTREDSPCNAQGGLLKPKQSQPSMSGPMKNKWIAIGATAVGLLLEAAGAAARSYNPLMWIRKPTASQQLSA